MDFLWIFEYVHVFFVIFSILYLRHIILHKIVQLDFNIQMDFFWIFEYIHVFQFLIFLPPPTHYHIILHKVVKLDFNIRLLHAWMSQLYCNSLCSDNSYHYRVYHVLLLIYYVFADVDIITHVINAITAIRLLYVDKKC